jgi:hypothetical protein
MKRILFLALILLAIEGFSQNGSSVKPKGQNHLSFQKGKSELVISGTYRLRGEIQHNFNAKTYGETGNESFLLSRLRLDLEYRFANRLKLFTEIQDSRVAGSSFTDADFRGKSNPYHDPFDINKLYVSYKPVDSLEFIVGRQSIDLGNRRVFGPGDWGNTGRYIWDAVNIRYANKNFSTQALFGYNILHQPDVFPNRNKEGGNTFASYNTIKKLPFGLAFFYVNHYDHNAKYTGENGILGDLNTNYLGGRFQKAFHQLNWMFLYSYEFGRYASDRISAQGVTTQLSYPFNTSWKPQVLLTYIYGSGDRNPKDGKRQTFDGIFSGADTDLYSWMNFAFWKNIHQARADLVLNPTKKISFRSEYHAYFLDQTSDAWYFPGKAMRIDKQGQSGSFIGQETDFTIKIKLSDWLQFLSGYCMFIPGEFVENTGTSPVARWAFGQLTFSF